MKPVSAPLGTLKGRSMEANKRKRPHLGLERRVRVRIEEESSEHELDRSDSEDEAHSRESDGNSSDASGSGDNFEALEPSEDDSDTSSEASGPPADDVVEVSFGALARAQASLPSPGTRPSERDKEPSGRQGRTSETKSGRPHGSDADRAKAAARSNKHAPMEMSSKKPVSRKREVVTSSVPKVQPRDPRFDPATGAAGGSVDEVRARKAYAFLDEYRADEMRQLRGAIKAAKTAETKEELQRALRSMESKRQTQERKDKEKALVEEHRRREKELVRQGKKPFYLKRSEQKKRLLTDQFASMKKKQVDRVIERKRKKVAAKEKRELPLTRRGAESG